MTVLSVIVNGSKFPVLYMHDVSMTKEAQEKHHIRVKTWRVETHMPVSQNNIFTSDVVMVVFFSPDTFDPVNPIYVPICLLEKKIGATKLLEAYHYDGHGYVEQSKFTHTLNGFLGCTSSLNLCFYLLKKIIGTETRSMYTIYFVDRHYLDNDKDNDEPCDRSLEEFLRAVGHE